MPILDVPLAVRRKALALGLAGSQWLSDLAGLVAELADEWSLRVHGGAISGGSGAYVTRAVTAGGEKVVLKVAIPDGLAGECPFDRELRALQLGTGGTYAEVLRADEPRRAMLLERLGRPLSTLGLPVASQIDVIAATLARAWRAVPAATPLTTGAEQARWLHAFIAETWEALGRPCPRATVNRALEFARAREEAFDPSRSVLVHGDAHPGNLLKDVSPTGSPGAFKLIDPEGLFSEPAHDLAIPLRDWSEQLLAGDPVGLGRAWCTQLGERTGVSPRAIWEWAFVERVSSGLFLIQLGDTAHGARLLTVANHWVEVPA